MPVLEVVLHEAGLPRVEQPGDGGQRVGPARRVEGGVVDDADDVIELDVLDLCPPWVWRRAASDAGEEPPDQFALSMKLTPSFLRKGAS